MTVLPIRPGAPRRMSPEELRATITLLRYRARAGHGGRWVRISCELAQELADHLQATEGGTGG